MELIPRFFRPPGQSYFLFGPRGTGKSTWIRATYPGAIRIDLLAPDTFRAFSARPERLRELVHGNPDSTQIIIDEVQKVPTLLDVVHGLIEEDRRRLFVLTGSSSRKLKRSGVDLLAGRALDMSLHPYMAAEIGTHFRLEQALRTGMIPLVLGSPDPESVLRSYASLYLREEVQSEGFVRNLGDFSRFLEVVSFSHASVLNVAELSREAEVGRKTAEAYISVLEDLLLSFTVPVFSKRAKRILTVHPKFFLFDAGVFRSLRPAGPLDRPEEIDGVALEGLVAQHLRAWIAYRGRRNALHFWRTKSGTEVDFVVYGEDGLFAIEVKNAARVRRSDLTGLRSFREDYPEAEESILLYQGTERLEIDGIRCVPVDEYLKALRPESPLSVRSGTP